AERRQTAPARFASATERSKALTSPRFGSSTMTSSTISSSPARRRTCSKSLSESGPSSIWTPPAPSVAQYSRKSSGDFRRGDREKEYWTIPIVVLGALPATDAKARFDAAVIPSGPRERRNSRRLIMVALGDFA